MDKMREISPATPSVEMRRNDSVQPENEKWGNRVQTDLAEALMYFAEGKREMGRIALDSAFWWAKENFVKITPQEIAYVVSGGKGTPPPEKPQEQPVVSKPQQPETNEPVKNNTLLGYMDNFKAKALELLKPLEEIEKQIREILNRAIAILEKASPEVQPQRV